MSGKKYEFEELEQNTLAEEKSNNIANGTLVDQLFDIFGQESVEIK